MNARQLFAATLALLVTASWSQAQAGRHHRSAQREQADISAVTAGTCPALPRRSSKKKRYAKRFFKLSIKLATEGKLDAAMKASECSFRARPKANAFYNYAKLAERLGLFTKAIFGYQRYLALNPKATDAIEVQEKIDVLQKALAEKRRKEEEARRAEEIKKQAEILARQKLAAERKAREEKERRKRMAEKKRLAELAKKRAEMEKRQAEIKAKLARIKAKEAEAKARMERILLARKLDAKRRKFTTSAWVLGGMGVAALAASAAFAGLSLADKRTVENAPQDEPWKGDVAKAYDQAKTFALASYITLGAGTLLVATAGVLYGLSRKVRVETPDRAGTSKGKKSSLLVLPMAGPRGGGIQVTLSF